MLTTRIGLSGVVRVLPAGFALAGLLLLAAGFLLLAAPASARAEAMSFRVATLADHAGRCHGRCPKVIVADGQITNSTPEEFVAFLRGVAGDPDMHTVVLLNSDGGYVVASMELGNIFRRIGAATVVQDRCLSACVYAFMGGKKRVAPPGSKLGIHRMYANQAQGGFFDPSMRRVYDDGSIAAMLKRYCARMGVSTEVIRSAEHVASQTLHFVTPNEMARWRLAGRAL